jgi:hypothetical protein
MSERKESECTKRMTFDSWSSSTTKRRWERQDGRQKGGETDVEEARGYWAFVSKRTKKRRKTMRERITKLVALFVASVLLVALSAGAALAQDSASEVRAANKSTKHHLPGVCLVGTIFADFIDDAGKNKNCLRGLAGNDVLAGFTNDDFIDGGDGDDRLFGESGNESSSTTGVHYIDGWTGNDTINPGTGNDTVLAFSGNDVIDGNYKYNFLGNGWQIDELGNDRLHGESGNDYIIDWKGYDKVYGSTGNDTINVRDGSGGDYVDAGEHFLDFDKVYADSGDTVLNAESVVKSAAGAKSGAELERPTPPSVSAKSSAQLKSGR